MNNPWVWIDAAVIRAIQEIQLTDHGGGAGIRDVGLLESALARPRQLSADGDPDAAMLAASYGYGLAKNHPFVDGNKRTAFVAVELFLELNGSVLNATDADCVITMVGVASGDLTEIQLAHWIRQHSVKR